MPIRSSESRRRRRLVVLLVIAGLVVAAAPFAYLRWIVPEQQRRLLTDAEAALLKGEFEDSEALALRILRRRPDNEEAARVAGQAALALGKTEEGLEHLENLLEERDSLALQALAAAADYHLLDGRPALAEPLYWRLLEYEPDNVVARRRLVQLLTLEGRGFESRPLRMSLIRDNAYVFNDLMYLGNPEAVLADPELSRYQQTDPDDPMPLVGLARLALANNEPGTAEQLLREVVAKRPDEAEAHARLGQVLLESGRHDAFLDWLQDTPAGAEVHPVTWYLRGLWAQRHGEHRGAARCFWETLRREPNHLAANYQLAVELNALGEPEQAEPFQRRAALLSQLVGVLDSVNNDPDNPRWHLELAELTEALGRYWESAGWWGVLVERESFEERALERRRYLGTLLRDDMPQVAVDADPAQQLDLSHYDVPQWDDFASGPTVADSTDTAIRFADVARMAGIDFTYYQSPDPLTVGARMFEFTGGGVAVLDYDADGLPDLYFTQGCPWPPTADEESSSYRDRLYRNLGNGRFEDVTQLAGLGDTNFSQGVAAGDLDGDGYPDLLVANIGTNRLYLNNGDGTFRRSDTGNGLEGDRWTTSCVIADLNGDALPEIFEVNYLEGPGVYERICTTAGRPTVCSPTEFSGQPDRLFRNLGNGRFEPWALPPPADGQAGRGLGIVAGNLAGSRGVDLLVANDMTPNHFYVVEPTEEPGLPVLQESAMSAGLAFDRDGRALACMGVAAGDVDDDGRTDLFVTNFFREANTLYRQWEPGMFLDETRERNLSESSYAVLGFGTQFLDADLDGDLDLVVANGHIDDFTHAGAPYRMPPQCYANEGGHFVELPPSQAGPYFERELLGRGLARLDYNGDGRDDFVVSHLDDPVALLENQSADVGNYLAVRLVGTTVSRDAIGSVVTLSYADRTSSRQLTAGDGYHASNERQLTMGLGSAAQVDRLSVEWPDGTIQEFEAVAPNQTVVIVQGRDEVFPVPSAGNPSPEDTGVATNG